MSYPSEPAAAARGVGGDGGKCRTILNLLDDGDGEGHLKLNAGDDCGGSKTTTLMMLLLLLLRGDRWSRLCGGVVVGGGD